jgi:hypothetical protein
MIWITKHIPSSDPKFHHALMFAGDGKSTSAPVAILSRGWVLRMGLFIMFLFDVGVLLKY